MRIKLAMIVALCAGPAWADGLKIGTSVWSAGAGTEQLCTTSDVPLSPPGAGYSGACEIRGDRCVPLKSEIDPMSETNDLVPNVPTYEFPGTSGCHISTLDHLDEAVAICAKHGGAIDLLNNKGERPYVWDRGWEACAAVQARADARDHAIVNEEAKKPAEGGKP